MKTLLRSGALGLMILFAAPAMAAEPAQFDVTTTGTGKPLILIPGLASSGAVWDTTVEHLCKRGAYQCHVVSLAGFAGKPAVAAPSLDTVTRQLLDYLRTNKLDKSTVIGHSLGGFLALRLAIEAPQLIGRVVAVDSLPALGAAQVPSLTSDQLREQAARQRTAMLAQPAEQFAAGSLAMSRGMVGSPAQAEKIAAWSIASDRNTVVQAMTDLMGTDLRPEVGRIAAPLLVLGSWIAYKDFAPKSAIEATFRDQYRLAPKAQIEMSDSARHFIMFDDPAWMLARIERFLAQ